MIVRQTALTGLIALSLSAAAGASGVPRLPAELGASFVITAAGELYAWENNDYGSLGIGTTNAWVDAPVLVARPQGVRGWRAVAGGSTSAAIGDDGNLYRWGRTNFSSSSGPFQLTPLLVPKPSTVSRWLHVATRDGSWSPMAVADDGNLYLYRWDSHPVGLLVVPKPDGVTSWLKVSTSRSYYLALANNGELFELVELTSTSRTNSLPALEIAPRKLARPRGVTRWIDSSSTVSHGLALGDNHELYYVWPPWGLVARPDSITYWKSISAGYNLSAAIGSDDRVYVWHPWDSQLVPVSFPQPVRKWISVAAGLNRALMIGDDCRLYRTWEYYPPVLVKNLEHLCVPALPETTPGLLTLAPLHPLFQREREFRFHVLGNAAEPFALLRSPDLKNWMPLFTNVPFAGWRALSDTNVGNATSFFYRIAPP